MIALQGGGTSMTVTLRSYSHSFATRGLAREILQSIQPESPQTLAVDFTDVMASPSFLAEFFQGLVERGVTVVLVGLDDFQANTASRLIRQLGLSQRVSIDRRVLA